MTGHSPVDAAPPSPPASGLKGMFMPVGIVLLICTIFVSVYLAAFHAPKPRDLPVAVVGSAQQADQVQAGLDKGVSGGFEVKTYADEAAARDDLEHRKVYGVYVAQTGKLLHAGANGASVSGAVTGAFGHVAEATGHQAAVEDVLPAVKGDARGLSVFYAAFGVVLAGFLFGTMTYQAAPRLKYAQRMISLGTFSVVGGIIVALVAQNGFDALPGSFVGVAGLVAMMAFSIGAATMLFIRLIGPPGMSLASVVLLIFGNATSGGIMPAQFLPAWLAPVSHVLPVGVGVRAVNGVAYFSNDGLTAGILTLAAWIVVCAGLLYYKDVHSVRPAARAKAPEKELVAA